MTITDDRLGPVDIYPVGVLDDLLRIGRALRHRHPKAIRHAMSSARSSARLIRKWARAGNWRAVRNTWNGYLAEPTDTAVCAVIRRCGTGWTKRAALRSLHRAYDRALAEASPESTGHPDGLRES